MLSSARFRRLAVQVTVVSLATAAPVALAAAAAQAAPGDPGTPALSLVTSTSPRTITAANQTITYTFTVQNNGPVTVDELTVDSTFTAPAGPMSIVSCDTGTLAAGESTTCTGTYLSTQDDVDAGTVESSAVANADDPQGDPVDSNASTATVPADQRPSLSLIESADPLSVHAQGDTVDYTFTIENTGNVTVRDVSVDDSPAPPAGPAPDVTCPTAPLAPGQRADCTASYTVTQPDIDHGTIGDSAVADADSPAGPVQSAASSATVTVTQDDGLTLEQTADPMTLSAAGQTVAYTFDVTNSGNVTVSGLSLDDTLTAPAGPALAIDCPTAVLAPGEDTRCTATYRSTQADVDHGRIDNVATATGRSPGGDPVASGGTATTVTIARTNGLDLVESSSTATVTAVGRVVTYSFLVTNTGNTTIGDLTVTDVFAPPAGPASTPSCPQISLLPGRSTTCTADYAVSRADLDNGTIDNTATAHGRAPDDTVVDSSPSTAAITALQRPGLDLEVTATVDDRDHDGSHDLGDRITWTIVVTNSGNVTLTDVAVGDLAPGAVSCPSTAVPAGTSMTCTHTHAITQADVDRGHVDDTANAAGSDPGRRPIAAAPAGVSTPIDSTDGLQVLQTASVSSVAVVGQHVSYTFLVTDTGTTTLTDVRLTDTLTSPARPALTLVCPSSATLEPGATLTCTADYKSTQADFDNGSITNRVSAAAAAPSGAPVTAEPSTAIVSTVQTPTLGLVKKASVSDLNGNGYADLDDTIRWTFVVTNTGTVTWITSPSATRWPTPSRARRRR